MFQWDPLKIVTLKHSAKGAMTDACRRTIWIKPSIGKATAGM